MTVSEGGRGLSSSNGVAWRGFARAVSEGAGLRGQHNGRAGELIIMGGGLGASDLLPEVSSALEEADVVLYCLADIVTQVMIQRRRPDAIDLSIFYNAQQPRYQTYVQMAEAMLHPARCGKRVLALYYGHPGIFAMPTHRALAIARIEGISAKMRPGISALDYLIADIGFDPAYPGLLSYETTDMLLRHRRLDPSVHTVLWQIGVVGEMGHSRKGFRNDSFDLMLDRIEAVYGDADVVHYIGSRFPGVPPLVEAVRVNILRETSGRRNITALSTLYIPPCEAGTNDPEIAAAMRLGEINTAPSGSPPRFNITNYGPHEHVAIQNLSIFEIPDDYHFAVETPGVCFMLDLHDDPALRRAYENDARALLSRDDYRSLTDEAKELLVARTTSSAHQAMYQGWRADG